MENLLAKDFKPCMLRNLTKIYSSGDFSFYYDPKSELCRILITQKLISLEAVYVTRLVVDKGHSILVVIYGDVQRDKELRSLYYAGAKKVDAVEFLIGKVIEIAEIKAPQQQKELSRAIRKVLLTELFDIESENSFWTCYLASQEGEKINVILRRTLSSKKNEPEAEYTYTFSSLSKEDMLKNEGDLLHTFRYVIKNFEEIGGKKLTEAFRKGLLRNYCF